MRAIEDELALESRELSSVRPDRQGGRAHVGGGNVDGLYIDYRGISDAGDSHLFGLSILHLATYVWCEYLRVGLRGRPCLSPSARQAICKADSREASRFWNAASLPTFTWNGCLIRFTNCVATSRSKTTVTSFIGSNPASVTHCPGIKIRAGRAKMRQDTKSS